MAISRYSFTGKINLLGKPLFATNSINARIQKAAADRLIECEIHVMSEGERLDQVSFKFYGDPSYWWVIAAASGIGWPLQLPPGTVVRIPKSLEAALGFAL